MKYIIDTDPGIDDAIAIMLGYLNNLDILGFTLATGNISLEKTENNLKTIQNILGSNIKMYKGSKINENHMLTAEYAHGKDGLGNIFMPKINQNFEEKLAEDFIIEAANEYKDNLTIICLGPLTNLASALKKDENLTKKIKHIIIMGSTYNPDVLEPYKEFNVKIDPNAAKLIFSASFEDIKIITHDIGVKSFIEKEYINSLKNSSLKTSRFVYAISQKYMEFSFNKYNINGLATPDPTTMAYAINPELISFKPCTIEIKEDISYVNLTNNSNIFVSVDLDINEFRNLFKKTFY